MEFVRYSIETQYIGLEVQSTDYKLPHEVLHPGKEKARKMLGNMGGNFKPAIKKHWYTIKISIFMNFISYFLQPFFPYRKSSTQLGYLIINSCYYAAITTVGMFLIFPL